MPQLVNYWKSCSIHYLQGGANFDGFVGCENNTLVVLKVWKVVNKPEIQWIISMPNHGMICHGQVHHVTRSTLVYTIDFVYTI